MHTTGREGNLCGSKRPGEERLRNGRSLRFQVRKLSKHALVRYDEDPRQQRGNLLSQFQAAAMEVLQYTCP